jgi:hypothetical protein
MPPVISRVDTTVTSWTFQATDVRNIPPQPLPCPTVAPQVESGLDSIELLALPVSRNIGLVRLDSLSKESLRPTLSARFRCFVTDPKRDAKAVFEVVDHRGNRSRDSVSFSAPTSMTENRTPVTPLVWFDGRSLYVEHATEQTPICVTIHDVSGRRVSQGVHGSGRSVIPLDLPLGLYVVLAQVGASSQISTFIVLP